MKDFERRRHYSRYHRIDLTSHDSRERDVGVQDAIPSDEERGHRLSIDVRRELDADAAETHERSHGRVERRLEEAKDRELPISELRRRGRLLVANE